MSKASTATIIYKEKLCFWSV